MADADGIAAIAAVLTAAATGDHEVDANVVGIAQAANGHGGLSYLAETLHAQVGRYGGE